MSIRLATLLAAAAFLLGGCAQSDLAGLDDLSALSNVLPVDVIYDKPAPAAEPTQPSNAAAWGETTVTTPEPIKVADWGQTSVYRGEPMVSPVPVGPPMVAAPPPGPIAWGPAVVMGVGPSGGPTGFEPYLLDTGDRLRMFVYGQPNLSRLYTVDHDGNIAVPLIGAVRPAAARRVDLERNIAAKLGREFVSDPQVTVDVQQNRPFFILGEVRTAGPVPLRLRHDGRDRRRHRRRLHRARLRAHVPHHPPLDGLVDQIEAPADYRRARATPSSSTNGSSEAQVNIGSAVWPSACASCIVLRAPVGGLFRHVLDLAASRPRAGMTSACIVDSNRRPTP